MRFEELAGFGMFTKNRKFDANWGFLPPPSGKYIAFARIDYGDVLHHFYPSEPRQALRAIEIAIDFGQGLKNKRNNRASKRFRRED